MVKSISIEKVQRLLEKNPDKLPVIIHKKNDTKNVIKFMIPTEATVLDFLYVLRKRINLEPTQSIYLSIKDSNNKYTMLASNLNMGQIYEQYKTEELLLEMIYCEENTFG